MEVSVQKALTDKLYDKRKAGAYEYVMSFLNFRDNVSPKTAVETSA
jgi:hypothetical protein